MVNLKPTINYNNTLIKAQIYNNTLIKVQITCITAVSDSETHSERLILENNIFYLYSLVR